MQHERQSGLERSLRFPALEVIPDKSRQLDNDNFHLLLKLDESKFTFPTVKASRPTVKSSVVSLAGP